MDTQTRILNIETFCMSIYCIIIIMHFLHTLYSFVCMSPSESGSWVKRQYFDAPFMSSAELSLLTDFLFFITGWNTVCGLYTTARSVCSTQTSRSVDLARPYLGLVLEAKAFYDFGNHGHMYIIS